MTTFHAPPPACSRTIPIAAMIAAATGMPLAASAQCNISRTGTPDFDQRRLFLPNDGRMYCAPVAVANQLALLANSGYPAAFGVQSGGTNWQSPGVYPLVTNRIAQLGNMMSTDAFDGTNLDNARTGAQQWLNQNAPGEFVVLSFHAFENLNLSPANLYAAQKQGAYVSAVWGRYNATGSGFTRNGGHVISMTALQAACGDLPRMYWRDPDDAGSVPDDTQSWFTSRTDFLVKTTGPFRPSASAAYTQPALWRFSNSSNRMLDAYIAIMPLKLVTPLQGPGEIALHNPVQPIGLLLPAVQKFQVPSPEQAREVVLDSRLSAMYVVTGTSRGVEYTWKVEEGEAAVPLMETQGTTLLAAGRSGQLYIAAGRTLHLMNVWAEPPVLIDTIVLPDPCDALAYDDASDQVLALSSSARRMARIDRDLANAPLSADIPSNVPLGNECSIVPGPGGLTLIASDASPSIFALGTAAGGSPVLSEIIVTGATGFPQSVQIDDRGNLFFIDDGEIQELQKDAATGAWIPAPGSILAGTPAYRRFALARSRTNYNPATMSGPEYHEIGPADEPGTPDCYANCDLSSTAPILNVDDFTCFINKFAFAQTLSHQAQILNYANCDDSTTAPVLNVDDFICFINTFALGCPQ